ncbi:MAG: DUF4259 domain-containing protein [Actinobacteria bacterium]|jgi:hypothetical protein|nr:DUF4259 domain-containing protein [Actinomycetota bacterium]
MGAIGTGVFENDDALDFLGDLEELDPPARTERVLGALDEVLLNPGYVEAPEMSEALAAAGAVGASLNPAAAQAEPYRPEWLVGGAVPLTDGVVEKSRQVLRRAVRSTDNEWRELWVEAELLSDVTAACQRVLTWLGDRDD